VPFLPADLSRRRFKSVHRPTRSTLTTSRSSHWEKERRFTSLWISTGSGYEPSTVKLSGDCLGSRAGLA
jgi:hypothetical protein